MLGNFTYHNPTKLYFGKDAVDSLKGELKNYGDNVLLVYGGGSIKKNGIYDRISAILKECGKNVAEGCATIQRLYRSVFTVMTIRGTSILSALKSQAVR